MGEETTQLMDAAEMTACLERLADELAALSQPLAVVGIRRRGVPLGQRLARLLEERTGSPVDLGCLDITLYRDDLSLVGPQPTVGETDLPFDITGKRLVLVDDVVFTGRTVRAALDELADFGRPARIELFALIDRGHRELPIQPDYVGRTVATEHDERIDVRVVEIDGRDAVELLRPARGEEAQ